ncbi:MAG: hypothetical protein IPJ94_17850 [Chloroflexi bacterium]|nr:hypothetical protein [Chloroflexota bacterium]
MTNHHVIGGREAAQPCAFQFNYQLDKQLHPCPSWRRGPNRMAFSTPTLTWM